MAYGAGIHTGGGGSGDASGPASSTDNAITRFDGTGGKTLQNSGITIDDSDNISGVTSLAADADTAIVLTNHTDGSGGNSATLTNGPIAGNPAVWFRISVNGTARWIPGWSA